MDVRWTEKRLAASREVAFEESLLSQRIFLATVRLFLLALVGSVVIAAWMLFRLSLLSQIAAVLVCLPGLFLLRRRPD